MKIFVINSGSSSIKCSLYDFASYPHSYISPIWESHLEWKNTPGKDQISQDLTQLVNSLWQGENAPLTSLKEIDVIGHRIVHGGNEFKESVFINVHVKEKIRELVELAPLHNLADLEGIELMEKLFKDISQVAVFDTAFHHTLSKPAAIYPGPYYWYKEDIQRYGFHGISFHYCLKRTSEILHQDARHLKIIICHLGSGASLCAIKEGKSIDTTMGFTPLDGLMMDTRSGSIDPGILLYLIAKKGKDIHELSHELYYESGLLGISGTSSDMREIMKKASAGDPRAALAFETYLHRLSSNLGSMLAALKGIDLIVFTAGIGENVPLIRQRVCDNFAFLGLHLDQHKNALQHKEDCELSTPDSRVRVLLIHTQETFEIARECWHLVSHI